MVFFATALTHAQNHHPSPPASPGWDKYQVILWSTQAPSSPQQWPDRIRELGFTAVPSDPGVPAPGGLPYYVENMVPELAFHHARQAIYDADFQQYSRTGEKRFLIRKPCVDDPNFWAQVTPRLMAQASQNAPHHPLLYDLRDEPSLGSFVSPMDYCFCPHTLRAFRVWLQDQYKSLAALNAEWDTAFSKWDDVVPLTTFEIKDRERAALAAGRAENYAAWADHRAFMDYSFAKAIDRMRSIIHSKDPRTPVGIAGVQMPSAWGGYDLWRLSQVVDWMEPYDVANSRAILGSFLPEHAPILATYFGSDAANLRRTAWMRLLDGDRGAIVWDDDPERVILKSAANMPITQRGRDIRDIFEAIRPAAARLAPLHRIGDRIAIHYSQASIRAQWMFDSREDGKTWPRRLTSYELEHSRIIQIRSRYIKVIEDLGFTPEFVSYEQIERGELTHSKYRALLMPGSVALSDSECARIEEFVRAGGLAVADSDVGILDEHCRRLPPGRRLSFYRSINRGGPGVVEQALRTAGIGPEAKISGAGEIKLWRFGGDRSILALMQNPAQKPRNPQPVSVHVLLPQAAHVRDSAKDYGVVSALDLQVGYWSPTLLELISPDRVRNPRK